MKKIIYSLGFLFAISLIFVSCEEDEINFDYADYTPVLVGDIDGAASTFASGLAPVTYSVVNRGGSTYAWTVTGAGATIVLDEQYPNLAYITFDQSDVDIPGVVISCTETAAGGNTSNTLTKTVDLLKFKAMAWADFVGTWTGTEDDGGAGGAWAVTANIVQGATTNTIVLTAPGGGVPAVMVPLFAGWGEFFMDTYGDVGAMTLTLDLNTGAVNVACPYFGRTTMDPYDYWLHGTGTWDGVTETININFGLDFDGGCDRDYNNTTLIITKD